MRITRRGLLVGAGAGVVAVRALAEPPPVRLVLVVANGGWDPTFHVDPHPGTVDGPYPDLDRDHPDDVEVLAEYGDVRVTLNERRRPALSRFFEAHGSRVAVVNGLWVGSLSHWQGTVRVLTGTTLESEPDVATIAGVELGSHRPLASVDLSGLSRMGSYGPMCARSGVRGQLKALLDADARFPLEDGSRRPAFTPTDADEDAIRAWLDARSARDADPSRLAWHRDRAEARTRADRLAALGPGLVRDLPTGRRTTFTDDVAFALELLRGDACHSVVLSCGEMRWDTHGRSSAQHDLVDDAFAGLQALCDGLLADGALDSTLVAVVSEFGRTPFRNADGGTDHWPYTSALLLGADTAGGRRLGGTDDGLVGLPALDGGPIRYDQLAAGVLEAVGVDRGEWLPGVTPLRGFRL